MNRPATIVIGETPVTPLSMGSLTEQKARRTKLLIIGHAGHGKDTVKDIIMEHTSLESMDSSRYALETFMWDKLRDKYDSMREAYEDRRSPENRVMWHNSIAEYNTPDKVRLARQLLEDYDVYTGMRCDKELHASIKEGLFDLIIWVDGSDRCPPEGSGSMKINKSYADIIIDNNGTEAELVAKVMRLINTWNF